MLIAFAGIIFGSIFIYTNNIVFTAVIHGLYDAVLSINLIPFRLSNEIVLPLLFLIMLVFLLIINKKLYPNQQSDEAGPSDQDNLSLG
jgi:membrane protease YdiL (CAAX protease family)